MMLRFKRNKLQVVDTTVERITDAAKQTFYTITKAGLLMAVITPEGSLIKYAEYKADKDVELAILKIQSYIADKQLEQGELDELA